MVRRKLTKKEIFIMKIIRNAIALLCLFSVLVCTFVSCGGEIESLRLAADKTVAKPGETVIFNTTHITKKGEALTDEVTYKITAGSEHASLDGNKLAIPETAKDGSVITVVSEMNGMVSNEVSVMVRIPRNSISISADKVTAQHGEVVTIKIDLTEDGNAISADDAEIEITKGADAVTRVGTKLTINEGVASGTEIELVAKYKDLVSNTVKITVSIPVTGITASASKSFVPAGTFVALTKTIDPAEAVASIEWIVTEGADICTVSGDMLAVNTNAPKGAVIKLHAACGDIRSNELSFIVGEEVETYYLMLSSSSLTVDRYGASDSVLTASVYDSKLQPITDRTVSFEIISGNKNLGLTSSGNVCHLSATGHGDAVIRVSLPGTNVSQNVSVKVIVPPDAVKLPEMFTERLGHDYNFSMTNLSTGKADRLDFSASTIGTNACTKLKYAFAHADGTTGESVAVWADGKITFKKQGRVTVTVSSDSGSRNEVATSYSFYVNSGYNVRNYAELKNLLESNSYNGEIINVVITEKPVGANSYKYGYDLVPTAALKASADQTWQDVLYNSMIHAKNKNVYINGNRHKLDGSQLRVISGAELDSLNNQGYDFSNISALLRISPEASDPAQIAGRQHSVKIFDFEVVGNTPINFSGDRDGKVPRGSYNTGIYIGSADYKVVYHLEMENVSASRCHVGLRFRRTVSDSTVDNIKVYNCFSNGIETEASIITFGNMTFGKCGAAGLEMVPANSTSAGDSMDQAQKITFAGVIDASENLSKGDSIYLTEFGVKPLLLGVVQQYQNNQSALSHMMNENGEFNFVTFIFNDMSIGMNMSQAVYPAYQNGGIINAADLPTSGFDTQHEYVLLEINLGGVPYGYALLYNHHFAK